MNDLHHHPKHWLQERRSWAKISERSAACSNGFNLTHLSKHQNSGLTVPGLVKPEQLEYQHSRTYIEPGNKSRSIKQDYKKN